jgi:hypothetical protein
MLEALKSSWRRVKAGRPGTRFREVYEARRHRGGPLSASRVIAIAIGLVLLFAGLAIGWLPGPGGFVSVIGCALLAAEFWFFARLLDWSELKLVGIWRRLRKHGA